MRRLIAALLLLAAPAAAQDVPAMLGAAAPGVVRVQAARCAGLPERSASGFVWERAEQVVTALHVVAGCERVTVAFQGLGEREAVVERRLHGRDLALLRVADARGPPAGARPLRLAEAPPGPDEPVWVYGYGGGRFTREDRRLRVTHANRDAPLLIHALDEVAHRELRALGSPRLDTEVLRVEGFLLPGDSGAPVLDRAGLVVAIGSGGLQRGLVGAGWAVRARYLRELAASTEAPSALPSAPSSARFALVDPRLAADLRCGAVTFRRTRELGLMELVQTSDDVMGFGQIAAGSGRPLDAFAHLRFEVWIEAESGIAVAVPAGRRLDSGPAGCRVMLGPRGEFEYRFGGERMPPGPDGPARFGAAWDRFFRSWAGEFLPMLQPDPAWTYPQPRLVRDGWVHRGAFGIPPLPHRPAAYVFQAHLISRGIAVGVATINRAFWMGPVAMQPRDYAEELSRGYFSTHLSTIAEERQSVAATSR